MDRKILHPFILQTPSVQAWNHNFHPFSPPLFHTLPQFMAWLTVYCSKPSSPAPPPLPSTFSILSEIAKVSGVCCYIASEKLVTLKASRLGVSVYNLGYERKVVLSIFFPPPASAIQEIPLDDVWYKNIHSGAFLCLIAEDRPAPPTQESFVE